MGVAPRLIAQNPDADAFSSLYEKAVKEASRSLVKSTRNSRGRFIPSNLGKVDGEILKAIERYERELIGRGEQYSITFWSERDGRFDVRTNYSNSPNTVVFLDQDSKVFKFRKLDRSRDSLKWSVEVFSNLLHYYAYWCNSCNVVHLDKWELGELGELPMPVVVTQEIEGELGGEDRGQIVIDASIEKAISNFTDYVCVYWSEKLNSYVSSVEVAEPDIIVYFDRDSNYFMQAPIRFKEQVLSKFPTNFCVEVSSLTQTVLLSWCAGCHDVHADKWTFSENSEVSVIGVTRLNHNDKKSKALLR